MLLLLHLKPYFGIINFNSNSANQLFTPYQSKIIPTDFKSQPTDSRCQLCAVNSICLPSGLSKNELCELENIMTTSKVVEKSAQLFTDGEDFNSLYIVHSGMFKNSSLDENGKERIIRFSLPGEIMGLDGIHAERYQSTAVALTTSSYCKIPFNQLLDISEDFPIIQRNLLKIMSKEIYANKKTYIDLGSTAKLALFIYNISQRFKNRGYSEKEFYLPISQRDIANYLGMAEETLSRIFKKLQKLGAVRYKKHILSILNKQQLQEVAQLISKSD